MIYVLIYIAGIILSYYYIRWADKRNGSYERTWKYAKSIFRWSLFLWWFCIIVLTAFRIAEFVEKKIIVKLPKFPSRPPKWL